MDERFALVGLRPAAPAVKKPSRRGNLPLASIAVLAVILLGCLLVPVFLPADPGYMDLYSANAAPGRTAWFGADPLGRDLFAMIWSGGRISLLIGFLAAAVSTAVAVVYGAASALAPRWLDGLLMRLSDIFLSVPSLLLVVLLQAVLGGAGIFSIALVVGLTGWPAMARVVRTEALRLRSSEYVAAARCMGAGFWRILIRHLVPNFVSPVMFMVVMNIRSAIVAESTLSFMGLGLPVETVSWGSMLSLAERSMLSGCWWTVLIPGLFLIVTLYCITDIANALRRTIARRDSNL